MRKIVVKGREIFEKEQEEALRNYMIRHEGFPLELKNLWYVCGSPMSDLCKAQICVPVVEEVFEFLIFTRDIDNDESGLCWGDDAQFRHYSNFFWTLTYRMMYRARDQGRYEKMFKKDSDLFLNACEAVIMNELSKRGIVGEGREGFKALYMDREKLIITNEFDEDITNDLPKKELIGWLNHYIAIIEGMESVESRDTDKTK